MGTTTRARGRLGSPGDRWASCSSGRPNANVLPVPVRACPMMSDPLRARGSARDWIGKGSRIPSASRASAISALTPRSRNVRRGSLVVSVFVRAHASIWAGRALSAAASAAVRSASRAPRLPRGRRCGARGGAGRPSRRGPVPSGAAGCRAGRPPFGRAGPSALCCPGARCPGARCAAPRGLLRCGAPSASGRGGRCASAEPAAAGGSVRACGARPPITEPSLSRRPAAGHAASRGVPGRPRRPGAGRRGAPGGGTPRGGRNNPPAGPADPRRRSPRTPGGPPRGGARAGPDREGRPAGSAGWLTLPA